MNPNESNEQDIFKTGISISQTQTWFNSILEQLRQRRQDGPRPQITAAPDTSVLDKFVEPPSLLKSIMATAKGMLADRGRTIQMTATPLEVEELWAKSSSGVPGMLSVGLHVLLVVAMVIPAYLILKTPPATPTSVTVLYAPTMPVMPVMKDKSGGGGGGGRKALTPPSKGQLPRGADKQIVPPMVEFKNLAPELAVETTVIAPQLSMITPLPNIAFGDPNGVSGPLSAGPGTGGGIGTGTGSGIGSGKGGGVGPGEGGGIGGGVFNVGGGVSEPVLLSQVQPEYSDDGRKARIQGTVELLIIVNPDGTVKFDNVRKNLGYGLDQKAIDAVKKWKFVPGKKDGKAVATYVSVLVNFSLR